MRKSVQKYTEWRTSLHPPAVKQSIHMCLKQVRELEREDGNATVPNQCRLKQIHV